MGTEGAVLYNPALFRRRKCLSKEHRDSGYSLFARWSRSSIANTTRSSMSATYQIGNAAAHFVGKSPPSPPFSCIRSSGINVPNQVFQSSGN
jgi:hypothetical protein